MEPRPVDDGGGAPPRVADVRPFVAAQDFQRSRGFYEALGWSTVWADDGLALLELGDHRMYLQDLYVREWAENTVLVVVVDDPAGWQEHVAAALAAGDFGDARVAGPVVEDWGATVTYVWDPSGVLLQFMQLARADPPD